MSQRRATILRVAQEAGAIWRMSGAAQEYLAKDAPGLYRVLEELSTITKEAPRVEPVPEEPR